MKSMYVKIVLLVLIVGLLSACGAQASETPASTSPPTEVVVPTISSPVGTEAPTDLPPPTETAAPQNPQPQRNLRQPRSQPRRGRKARPLALQVMSFPSSKAAVSVAMEGIERRKDSF